jgi:hypothetical protein
MRVPDRWIPILVATVGVLGGLGGALIGGYISNQGQNERFKNEQEAARHDLRQDAYANYLQESYGFLLQIQLKHQKVASVTDKELAARANALVGAEAAVALFGRSGFQNLTNRLTSALASEDEETSTRLLKRFIRQAKKDIAGTE